jgi:hypothetical protein
MQETFKFILKSRQKFIELLDGLSIEQLNKIPTGFNNNIIWNFAHIVVSTQTLVYVRTGIKADTTWVNYNEDYKKVFQLFAKNSKNLFSLQRLYALNSRSFARYQK